ncbi:hypothetical protein LINGRAHAP2_LOCUS22771, partial [Linum grandiflorum]
ATEEELSLCANTSAIYTGGRFVVSPCYPSQIEISKTWQLKLGIRRVAKLDIRNWRAFTRRIYGGFFVMWMDWIILWYVCSIRTRLWYIDLDFRSALYKLAVCVVLLLIFKI